MASAAQAPLHAASDALLVLPSASAESPSLDQSMLVWHDDRKENGQSVPKNIWGRDLAGQRNQGEPFQITDYRAPQLNPDISGEWVVYQDARNGNWDILATNLTTSSVISVSLSAGQQQHPRVWGDYIVYQDEGLDPNESDVYLYQISTGTTTALATSPGYQGRPDIDNGWAVWIDLADPANAQLVLYNIASQATTAHPVQCDKSCRPRVANGSVVWHDFRDGHRDVYLYSLQTLTETAIITAGGDQLYPAVNDDLIVWQDEDTDGNWNVFGLDRATNQQFPLNVEPSSQIYPTLGNTHIAWQDNRNHTWDLYGYNWTDGVPAYPTAPLANPTDLMVGAYPDGEIHLSWTETTTTETGFVIQRAQGIFGTDWQDYFTLPPNANGFVDGATTPGQSYWYRVRATGPNGDSNYSNESYSTAFGSGGPSLDERYLHLLINEARMDPGAWGYPNEEAVNPIMWQPNLGYSARAHALGVNNSDCCQAHTDLALRGPGARAKASGYSYGVGENLYLGVFEDTTMEDVNQGLMDSSGHRVNMLEPSYKEAAVGYARSDERVGGSGQSGPEEDGRGIVVEVFSWGDEATVVPTLPSGIAVPYTGTEETEYVYLVSFWNEEQIAPSTAQVVIDSRAHPLSLRSGLPGRGTYVYTTTLPPGQHRYLFLFEWGSPERTTRLPASGDFAGPYVRDKFWYVDDSSPASGVGYLPEQPFRTIQEAIAVATAGDTIEVAAGLYEEKLSIPDGVHLRGAGRDSTIIRGDGNGSVITMGDESQLSGFAVLNSGTEYWDTNIWVDHGNSATIRESIILSGSMGISNVCLGCTESCESTLELTNNIIVNHLAIGVNSHCGLRAINNTIAANNQGIYLAGEDVTIKNNIVVLNRIAGISGEPAVNAASPSAPSTAPLTVDISYNDVWQNGGLNYQNVTPGAGSIEENPAFVDPGRGDLRLLSSSLCVDAGDPDPQWNDGNGTRSDMGAYGGPLVNTLPVAVPTPIVEPSPVMTATALPPTALPSALPPTMVPTTEPTVTMTATSVIAPTPLATPEPPISATVAPTDDGTTNPVLTATPTAARPVTGTPEPSESPLPQLTVTPPTVVADPTDSPSGTPAPTDEPPDGVVIDPNATQTPFVTIVPPGTATSPAPTPTATIDPITKPDPTNVPIGGTPESGRVSNVEIFLPATLR